MIMLRHNTGMPIFFCEVSSIATAAAKDVAVCPEGKDEPKGRLINGSRPLTVSKGRGRFIITFRIWSFIIHVKKRDAKTTYEVLRVLLRIKRTAAIKSHIKAASPACVSGISIAFNAVHLMLS